MARLRDTDACGIIGKPVRLAEIREVLADTFPEGAAGTEAKSSSALRAVPILYLDAEVLAEVAAISKRPAFLGEMIDHAVRDIERTTAGLIAALGDAQWDDVKKLAHALKGVSHQMGAFRLKNTAVSIMQTDIAGLEAVRTKLGTELADVSANSVAALREWRNSAKPNASGQSVA
jgi:HPt (histidine-containing phosphotransfer) domain-containing protein